MVLRRKCGDTLAIVLLERKHGYRYVIEFHSSVDPAWSWVHRDCWTRDVISAVWTWKHVKFDDGWFEY